MQIMASAFNNKISLSGACCESIKVSQTLLIEQSTFIQQVYTESKPKAIMIPDIKFEELKELIDNLQNGSSIKENLNEVTLQYGFKSEYGVPDETNVPLKKRSLDNTPPSSPANESLSDSKSQSHISQSVSTHLENLPNSSLLWPLLFQQAAVQNIFQSPLNSLQNLNASSQSNLSSYPPAVILSDPQSKSSQNKNDGLISCEDCDKMFKPSGLLTHRRRVHRLLQEPFKCCGQVFSTRWYYKEHMNSGDHLPELWK